MSGINISPQTALRCSVVFGCVKVLSETVAELPLKLYRKRPDGGRDIADDHPLHWLLADAPNEWTPASEFKLSMTARWCLDGSAYAFVSRVLAGGNENAPDDMGALVRSLDRLRDELHCHVCAVHHTGKDNARGSRGYSLLHCSVDTEIEVTRDANTGISTATVTKQRDVKTEGSVSLRLRRVQLGIDDDGEPVTSCVVERAEPQPRPAKKLTGAAKIAFDQLCNCLADHAQEIPPSRHVPTGVQGVTLGLWRGYLENAGIVNRKGSPREQFRRVRVTLQDLGFIGVFVWASHRVT